MTVAVRLLMSIHGQLMTSSPTSALSPRQPGGQTARAAIINDRKASAEDSTLSAIAYKFVHSIPSGALHSWVRLGEFP